MKIKELIFESDLEEAATSIQEVESQKLALYVLRTGSRLKAVLYSPEQAKKIIETTSVLEDPEERRHVMQTMRLRRSGGGGGLVYGVFTANYESRIEAFEIDTMAAKNSYGPLMYDILSSIGGWIVRDTVGISDAAKKVWTYMFTKRTDWDKEFLPEDFRVNNYKTGGKNNRKDNPLNYKYKIQSPVSINTLTNTHKSFLTSFKADPKEIENVISAFGSVFFEIMYAS